MDRIRLLLKLISISLKVILELIILMYYVDNNIHDNKIFRQSVKVLKKYKI